MTEPPHRPDLGHGDRWSPLNGNSPWWANMAVWILRQGLLFQIVVSGLLVGIVASMLGWVNSPMLTAFQKVADEAEAQVVILREIKDHNKKQEALLERVEKHLNTKW